MYSTHTIKLSTNLYFKLEKNNITDKKRINYIEHTFDIHINTLIGLLYIII